jgi:dihydrofolate synthase/folylpolyglutamate synthase
MTLEKPDFNSFENTTKALFSRVRGHIEPGAHRIQHLLHLQLLTSLNQIPTILVSGTNGKGTTCALLEKTFRRNDYKTALYTSPHLVSPTERIRINGCPVSQQEFLDNAKQVYDRAREKLPDATFFELITAIAFQLFAKANPDVFICEVGLGGRLDSTNVLSPDVSVITGIGLDHTEWLGPTESHIGYEKAFISRRNRPLVVGKVSPDALSGIKRAVSITGAHMIVPESVRSGKDPKISDNPISIAKEVLRQILTTTPYRISPEDVMAAAEEMHWPGRFDLRRIKGLPLLLDAAHNPHGVEFFLRECDRRTNLSGLPSPKIIVYATLADKDWKQCLQMLSSRAETLVLTRTQSQRAVPTDVLINYIESQQCLANCVGFESSSEALDHAVQLAAQKKGSVFVLGSLTLIGETLEHFGLPVFCEFERGDSCNAET